MVSIARASFARNPATVCAGAAIASWEISSSSGPNASCTLSAPVSVHARVKERRLAAAYSNTELAQKQLGFGGMFVVCNGVPISLLDKSIGNQAIKSQPFICVQIFGPFHAPSGHDIAKDRQFFVCDSDGFYHLIAPYAPDRPLCIYFTSLAGTGSAADHTQSSAGGTPRADSDKPLIHFSPRTVAPNFTNFLARNTVLAAVADSA